MTSYERKVPVSPRWRFIQFVPASPMGDIGMAWMHDTGIGVLSSVDVAEVNPPKAGIVAPHFHVSATFRSNPPRACTDQEMEVVRASFDMGGADEDNHGPGIARHLWMLCGRDREPACPCRADEQQVTVGPRTTTIEESA
ncbi:MAG: hypothetical protein EKK55_08790 [Rhodocyclaceae bacterium]|nr:MAG: hypothetical protein EKK55_08790 [Rhodocyclaceae bacterium]